LKKWEKGLLCGLIPETEVRDLLPLPGTWRPASILTVVYAAEKPKLRARCPLNELVFEGRMRN
jgi:nitroreductase